MIDVDTTVALVALSALTGCALGYLLGSRAPGTGSSQDRAGDDRAAGPTEAQKAVARLAAAGERFQEALNACQAPRERLIWLAQKTAELASASRECHALGIVRDPGGIDARWRPPLELRRDGQRVPVTAWQGVDRAFDALVATLDDPTADLQARARVFDQLAQAATRVEASLDDRTFVSELAMCTFCGKRAREVRKVIAGPDALICDECVDLCVEVLEDEIGEDWRSPDGNE